VRIALVAVTTGGALALFMAKAQPGRLWASLASLPTTSVLAAVAATMAGVMLGAVRWRSLLAAGEVEAGVSKLFAAITIGSAVNNLVPARGGDAVRVESAHQLTGAPRSAVVGTMISERILDGFVLALLVVVGALLDGIGGIFLWAGAAVAVATVGGALLAARFGSRILRGRLAGLEAGLAVFRVPRAVGPAVAASAGIWLAEIVMYGALARGFHLGISLGGILLIVGAGNLALAIPGAAAGLGSFELVTLAGAHGVGASGPELAAFVLAVHAVIVLPTTVTGALLARVALPKTFRFREPGRRKLLLPAPLVPARVPAPQRLSGVTR
jgi:uncharacterized membrane protein YbhN (UPF0104 family)